MDLNEMYQIVRAAEIAAEEAERERLKEIRNRMRDYLKTNVLRNNEVMLAVAKAVTGGNIARIAVPGVADELPELQQVAEEVFENGLRVFTEVADGNGWLQILVRKDNVQNAKVTVTVKPV